MGWGLRPKVVLLPDGGDNWAIEKRAKGLYGVELIAHGKTAHGSRPWEGDNALHVILDVLQTLRLQYLSTHPSDPTLSATVIKSGDAINQIPHFASARIDFRCFDMQDLTDYKRLIADMANMHNLDMNIINQGDPVIFDADHPEIQSFKQALLDTGHSVEYRDSYGTTDARFFTHHAIPCIIIEPHGGGRHSNDEWILATDLEKFYQLLERWAFTV